MSKRTPISANQAAADLEALAASLRKKGEVTYGHLATSQDIYKGMNAEYKRLNPVPVSPIGGSNLERLT